jgi:hypothetical protein
VIQEFWMNAYIFLKDVLSIRRMIPITIFQTVRKKKVYYTIIANVLSSMGSDLANMGSLLLEPATGMTG